MNRYRGMSRFWLVVFGLLPFFVQAADVAPTDPAQKKLCTDAWYNTIEKQFPTAVAGKQGPEIGSDQWKSAIEKNLEVKGKADVPSRDTESWCRYIDQQVHGSDNAIGSALAQGPSYSCEKVAPGSIESMVCNDKELSALDRKLSAAYEEAKKGTKAGTSTLEAEQRGWIKGRNDCWKSEDKSACLRDIYFRRIAELEARYELVSGIGPVYYQCDGNPATEVIVMFFETDPRTLVAKRGGVSSLMYIVPSGSGTRYQGRNETFWEHQNVATIGWGAGAPELRCRKAQ